MIQDMGTTVTLSDGHTVPLECLEAHNERQRQAQQRHLEQQRARAAAAPSGRCPFSSATNATCKDDCALYDGHHCALHRQASRDTQGKRCPISHSRCSDHCALYFNGCGLTSIFTTKGE